METAVRPVQHGRKRGRWRSEQKAAVLQEWQQGVPVEEVGRQLPRWIQDSNEVAPHRALGMQSPVQFDGDWMRSKLTHAPVQN